MGWIYYRMIVKVNKEVVTCIYRAKNCKNHFKIVRQIIFFFKMTWQLMWRNVRVEILNTMFQLLVIYIYIYIYFNKIQKFVFAYIRDKKNEK